MCLSPVSVLNPSKYVSLSHRDRYVMYVPCGRCCECQKSMANQWYYRTYYEIMDNLCFNKKDNFILFDTLTYSDKYLPHLSDVWPGCNGDLNFPCFNRKHYQDFFKLLRTRLERLGYDVFGRLRYFLTSEYGTSQSATHRPHYHILLFSSIPDLNPIELSRLVGECWKYGRTDGVQYRGSQYVISRCIIDSNTSLGSSLRVAKYVSKYVQKSCQFQEELDKRIAIVMNGLAEYAVSDVPDMSAEDWLSSEYGKRERRKLLRYVNQFHRQSQGFGLSALCDLDLNLLFENGCLYMPDNQQIKIPVALSTYYKRKLFYDLCEVDGRKVWIKNELGQQYDNKRKSVIRDYLVNRFECIKIDHSDLQFSSFQLADYLLNYRGRIYSESPTIFSCNTPSLNLIDRLNTTDDLVYSYVTGSDVLNFGRRFVTQSWLGVTGNYLGFVDDTAISVREFIDKYVFFDSKLEAVLSQLSKYTYNRGKQDAFSLRQKLVNVYKSFS